jgi:hypothetical protein
VEPFGSLYSKVLLFQKVVLLFLCSHPFDQWNKYQLWLSITTRVLHKSFTLEFKHCALEWIYGHHQTGHSQLTTETQLNSPYIEDSLIIAAWKNSDLV